MSVSVSWQHNNNNDLTLLKRVWRIGWSWDNAQVERLNGAGNYEGENIDYENGNEGGCAISSSEYDQ